jgi:Zn-dependent protease with chaperone function
LRLLVLAVVASGWTPAPSALARSPQNESIAEVQTTKNPPDRYELTPSERARAVAYSHRLYACYFVGVALSSLICLFIWRAGIARAFRDLAHRASSKLVVQCLIFVPMFLASVAALEWPLEVYSGFILERRFGLSRESFALWMRDWSVGVALNIFGGVLLMALLYSLIRRAPRAWWFYFWAATIPFALAVILIHPLVIDPLFYKFTHLAESHPELVARMEVMVKRAGLDIPESRIFLMNASSKTSVVNAYVTGLGASKRIVVWDTALAKLGDDETLLMVGHEAGHYALNHIPKEFAWIEFVVLVFSYLGFRVSRWIAGKWGPSSQLEGLSDLASAPILLLVLTWLLFLSAPLICGISRHYEHQADQFGLELADGVVADPNAAEVRSLEVLGKEDLEDPDPSPFIMFWLYTHPPLEERIEFAAHYKPWAEGKPLELVKPTH